MTRGLNAGFGEPVAHELPGLAARGIGAVRQGLMPAPAADLRPGGPDPVDVPHIRRLLAEFVDAPCWPLWIATPATLPYVPDGHDAQLLNEPNLHGWTPEAYAKVLNRALDETRPRGIRLWAGGIANLSAKDLDWLARVLQRAPRTTHVSVHRYPDKGHRFNQPKPGFSSRTAEMFRLGEVLDGRPYVVGEFGAHMAVETTGWWRWTRTMQLSERAQAEFLRAEFDFYARWGAHAAFCYQLADGPSDTRIDRYGIRTFDGRWKASAEVFAQ